MKNLLNPKWLFLINTLPIILLFLMFFGEYSIIKSLLKPENIHLWISYGLTLFFLGLSNFLYALFLYFKRKEVSVFYGISALLCYIPFLYFYGENSTEIIPFSIPQWMVSRNMFVYVGTFLMPTLAYSVLIIVVNLTPEEKEHKAWKNFLFAISVPISWYLFTQLILPLWKGFTDGFLNHSFIILFIVSTVVFFFFLVRSIYILAIKKADAWKKYQLLWKIPISLILPILGLLVNNGLIFNYLETNNSGIFGDFNNFWVYTLTVINSIFICLPNLNNKNYRTFLLIGRSITFAFTLYFFLVFLPFLPLSIIAIIIVGTGFLMLSPLILFVIHINELTQDIKFLQSFFSKKIINTIFILSFLILPIIITSTYIKDRLVLIESLDYIYNPDYSENYNINKNSLKKTLTNIKNHKEGSQRGFFGGETPFLSSFYNWIVLDNLVLSDVKINEIESVFFETTPYQLASETESNNEVKISNISSRSKFDKTQNAWISWVDLEITNNSKNSVLAEYSTQINLPTGCWISDYYLYVEGKKEKGILAEKKSAMWVFSQIRNTNRDPGILYYLSGNKVIFKVFPFANEEVRKTGIEFIHKEPVQICFDDKIVNLGNNIEQSQVLTEEINDIIYVSPNKKKTLDVVQRKPYYHFIVDVSNNKKEFKNEKLISKNRLSKNNAKISFTNTYISTVEIKDNWKSEYEKQKYEGGFYLDRAIKKTLFNSFKNNDNSFPIIVVITDNINNSILGKDYSDYKFLFPESDLFYNFCE